MIKADIIENNNCAMYTLES